MIYFDGKKLATEDMIPTSPWNLYDGTKDFSGNKWVSLDTWTKSEDTAPDDFIAYKKSGNWQGLSQNISVKKGEVYTLSANLFLSNDISPTTVIHFFAGQNSDYSATDKDSVIVIDSTQKNQWIRKSITFTVQKDATIQPRFEKNEDQGTFSISKIMLNKGAIALDWSYSLNDLRNLGGGN